MGYCNPPAANLGMGLDIALENDNVSQWAAGMMNFSTQKSIGGTGDDSTGGIR
jgi:hypothetical protein